MWRRKSLYREESAYVDKKEPMHSSNTLCREELAYVDNKDPYADKFRLMKTNLDLCK